MTTTPKQPKNYPGLADNSIDRLLARDDQRELDGFPKKIKLGKYVKPGNGKNVVVVPTVTEDKLIHDDIPDPSGEEEIGGTGEGDEGEVVGESPLHDQGEEGECNGAGNGSGGSHDISSSAYDLGRILTEKFNLPNLRDKGKKKAFLKYKYDLSDQNRGFGQILEKKATLRNVLETNIALGRVPDINNIDVGNLIVSPKDKVYRILSREKDYESQAMVFFLRDYSGSMEGKCTEQVVSQHVLIYSWLMYQYAERVTSRFILHDTNAKEVPDLHTYYNSKVAGGTQVSSAYRFVNETVEKEHLAKDYNIYVFHGSDGDDWETDGKEAIIELKQILTYANRTGITIVKHSYGSTQTNVEGYLANSGLLLEKKDLLRLDTFDEDVGEDRLIEGIRKLMEERK